MFKFSGRKKRKGFRNNEAGRGLLVFAHTGEVIRAEAELKKLGFEVRVKAPPPHLRTGCDLIIEFPLVQSPAVLDRLRSAGLEPLETLPVSDELLEPASVFQCRDYGAYLMVRAANMKITVDKTNLRIVNISGGGCPDVPYLASLLLGKNLFEADDPLKQGQTLCGYALQLAFDEAKRLCAG